MRDLKTLQENFLQYILSQPTLIQDAVLTDKLTATERLNIYRDAYYLRLLEVSCLDYPLLQATLGEKTFGELIRDYLAAHPSAFRSVRWFGKNLASFITNSPQYAKHTLWIEIANFEWALLKAFDEKDGARVQLQQMAEIAMEQWPNLVFQLHASVQRLDFKWNVIALWKAFKAEKKLKPQQAKKPCPWLIWREGLEVQFYSLSEDEAYVLDAMLQGLSFSDICAGVCTWIDPDEVPLYTASLLKRFLSDGLITRLYIA